MDRAGVEVTRVKIAELENFNPESRGIVTLGHLVGNLRLLARASYYGDWIDANGGSDGTYAPGNARYRIRCGLGGSMDHCYEGGWLFDLEAAYTFNGRYTLIAGANNVFDESGPRERLNTSADPRFSNWAGRKYANSVPWGSDGGFYYFRFRVDLD